MRLTPRNVQSSRGAPGRNSGTAPSVVTEAAKSNGPALGYAGAYAFANVVLALAGTLLMLI